MSIQSIRHSNLLLAIAENMPQADFADRLGIKPTQLTSLKKERRKVGDKMARRIEEVLGKSTGWMDSPRVRVMSVTTSGNDDYVEILRYDGGAESNYPAMTAHTAAVPKSWLDERNLNPDTLVTLTVSDESQYPRLIQGDDVVVNTDWGDKFSTGRTYAVYIGDSITLRTATPLISGGVRLGCRNPSFPGETLTEEQSKSLKVLGVCERFSADL